MKSNRITLLLATLGAATALVGAGCFAKDPTVDPDLPAAADAARKPAAAPAPAAVPATWADLQDQPFEMRAAFLTGLQHLEARVDDQIAALKAGRTGMLNQATDTTAWDQALKELEEARSALKAARTDATLATGANWAAAKQKIREAWDRVQTAIVRVQAAATR